MSNKKAANANALSAGVEPKIDKHVLEKKVRQYKEIKDHPKLRGTGQLLDRETEPIGSTKKLKKLKLTPRKKFARRGQYEDDDQGSEEE